MGKRYFAMIDGERRGPFELEELGREGVRPDTYVWCKGMADWEKAEDVADICRHFRRQVFDRMHPSKPKGGGGAGPEANAMTVPMEPTDDPYAEVPLRYREMVRRSGEDPTSFQPDQEEEQTTPPSPTLFPAIFLMLFCFPITGMVAVWYSYQAKRAWTEAMRSESKADQKLYSDEERRAFRVRAADCNRQAKMWLGITFFLGIIFYAFMGHKFF